MLGYHRWTQCWHCNHLLSHFDTVFHGHWPIDRKNRSIFTKAVAVGKRLPSVSHLITVRPMPINTVVFVDAQNRMTRIVLVDTSIGNVLVEARIV